MASHAITTDDVRIFVEQEDGKVPSIAGSPDMFQLVGHTSSVRVMKSIHGMNRPTGGLV